MQSTLKNALGDAYIFSDEPLQKKSVLFIEEHNQSLNGNIAAVLAAFFDDARFRDWTVRLAVQETNNGMSEADILNDHGIQYVVHGSVGFRKALEASQVIVTTELLPRYYIKRNGQTVIWLARKNSLDIDSNIRRQRTGVHQSLNVTDFLWLEAEDDRAQIERWFPQGTPFRVIVAAPPRFVLPQSEEADVVVSIRKRLMGEQYAAFEAKFKQLHSAMLDRNRRFLVRIPQERYNKFCDENVPSVLSYLRGDATAFCSMLRVAQCVVCDKKTEAEDALRTGCFCIVISNNYKDYEDLEESHPQRVRVVGSWEEAIAALREATFAEAADDDAGARAQNESAVRDGLRELLSLFEREESTAKRDDSATLLVISARLNQLLWKALGQYSQSGERIDILFRETDNDKLWQSTAELPEDIRVFCRTGGGEDTNALLKSEALFAKEVIRLLGDHHYRRILYVGKRGPFWDKLLKAMGEEPHVLSEEEFLTLLTDSLKDKLTALASSAKGFPEVTIDGEPYLDFGASENARYFVRKKEDGADIVTCFVKDADAAEKCREILRQRASSRIFLIDPEDVLKDDELAVGSSVCRISANVLPARLFFASDALALCRSETLNHIAAKLGKEVIYASGDSGKVKSIDDLCRILSVKSLDEVIPYDK